MLQYLLNTKEHPAKSCKKGTGDGISNSTGKGSSSSSPVALEVIGAGFGRTGTASLYAALNILGYKTHHMIEVVRNSGQGAGWLQITRDRAAGRPLDWQPVLGTYNAAVDWPAVSFLEELLAICPKAKVILTLRDFDKWYDSAKSTIFAIRDVMRTIQPPPYLAPLFRNLAEMGTMTDELIWWGTFGGRFNDKQYVRKVYEAHLAEVRRIVPPSQLLEFRVQDGWAPLCAFLGKPIPEAPFPHMNERDDFQRQIARMQANSRRLKVLSAVCNTLLAVPVAAVVALLMQRAVFRGR